MTVYLNGVAQDVLPDPIAGDVEDHLVLNGSKIPTWTALTTTLSELTLTPKASSSGPEGTIYYDSDDNHIYVGVE